MDQLTSRFRSLFRRQDVEEELDAELHFHLNQQILENLESGMSLEDARCSARRSFGSFNVVKEQCRESLGLTFIDNVKQDVWYSLRTMVRNRSLPSSWL